MGNEMNHRILIDRSLKWLQDKVFPLWFEVGVDHQTGIFVENLNFNRQPESTSRRAMVQARQIYSFTEGARMGLVDREQAHHLIHLSALSFVRNYMVDTGAIIHSVDEKGQPAHLDCDLYTQAFAIFALAQAYSVSQASEFKEAALRVIEYLEGYRQNPKGGFTEIKNNVTLYQSNPHMHLFEAFIAWREVDSDPFWKEKCDTIAELCQKKFIQKNQLLAEHFDSDWKPQLTDGKFVFEPGHHFEWAWLFCQYSPNYQTEKKSVAHQLYDQAHKWGVSQKTGLTMDEIWSDGSICKSSSRFWPQTERIKASVVLGHGPEADQAMKVLFQYFLDEENGIWKDTRLENGEYANVPVKASSLYHIINAISEFAKYRPQMGE